MKNVKRFLALLLAGSLAASCLGGCGQKENKQESSQSQDSSTQVSSQTLKLQHRQKPRKNQDRLQQILLPSLF